MYPVWRVVVVIHSLLFHITCSDTWDPAFSDPITPSSPRLVILVTAFRSGSTFIGELFNQNPNVLYEFEPFHSLVMRERRGKGFYKGESSRHTDDEVQMLNLQQMLNCTFVANPFINIMNKYYKCPATEEQIEELYGDGITTCSESEGMGPGIGPIRRYLCRKRDAVVLKVIRLRRIRDLELIKNIRSADIRVVQLMRDPRAMFRSRSGFKEIYAAKINHMEWIRLEKWQKLALEAHTECETYMNNLEYALNAPWLKGRYMTIKHDEMANRSAEIAEELYEFIGIPMHEDVKKYLNDVLGSASNEVGSEQKGDLRKGGTLNTYKDPKEVVDKWMKWRVRSIRNIDKQCARFIKKMGWPFLADPDKTNFETMEAPSEL